MKCLSELFKLKATSESHLKFKYNKLAQIGSNESRYLDMQQHGLIKRNKYLQALKAHIEMVSMGNTQNTK